MCRAEGGWEGDREVSLDPGCESDVPGLQAASPHRAGAHLHEEELQDLVHTAVH